MVFKFQSPPRCTVPIELAYEDYRYLEIDDEVYWIPLYPKLVTVTPPDKEHSSVYMDNEIEAKVGWLLYKQRVNSPLSQQQQIKAFKSFETRDAFYLLANYHQIGLSYNYDYFIFQYTMAARGLVNIRGYQHLGEKYNWNNIKIDFSILTALMINCPEL